MNQITSLTHLCIIMDGNRRWATEHGLPKLIGHTEGAKNLKKIAQAVSDRGIKYLTVWALSTENLKERGAEELKHLFALFEQLADYLEDFLKNNARLNLIGDLSKMPISTQEKLTAMVEKTKNHTGLTLTLAVNYGGRDEILRAIKKYTSDENANKNENITTENFDRYLDTHDLPEPEMIIRTGGHQRLSGFMAWQSIYSELYFTKTYWPAFDEKELDVALNWFQEQIKNHGK